MNEPSPTLSPSSTNDPTPRLRVVNLVDVPRGGWCYTVEATGVTISSGSINHLKRDVIRHMTANGLEIRGGIEDEIENTACYNLGAHKSHWCAEPKPAPNMTRSRWRAADVLRFLKTVLEWGVKEGFRFVPMEEANRRASICATCPMNVTVSGCLGCSGVGALVKRIRGSNVTAVDSRLNTCETCGCELKVKVLVPMGVIDNRGLVYPDACWQHQDTK